MLIGKLSIDNETDDYNASQPRQAVANQRTPPRKLHGSDTFE